MAEIVVKLVNGELAGKTAQSIAKEVNAAATALKKAEVGTKAWVEANKKLEETKQLQADLKKQIESTAEASETLKNAFNKLPGAETFNKITESFGGMKKGVGGLITQFGMLKTAIASTGIGLLVLALASLISYFTTTQEGIDKITAVTRPLAAIFERLKGLLQELGGKLFKQLEEAINNPKQALLDLGNIIKDNIINRFKALALFGPALKKIFAGDLTGGFKDLGNAAIQATTGIENAIDKIVEAGKAIIEIVDEAAQVGKRLDELQKSIERQEITQIGRLKQLDLLLKQQKDIVEDTTKSWDERREAAQKALTIQQTMLNEELSLLDKRIEKMKLEQSLNDTGREQQKELAELEAKKLELQARTVEQAIEFKKKVTEINTAQAAEELAITQNLQDLKVEAMREGMDKEIAQIELDTERKIEALIGTDAQIKEQELFLLQIREQEIQAIKDRYALEAAEKDKAAKDDQAKRDKEAAEKQVELAKKTAEQKKNAEEAWAQAQSDFFQLGVDLLGQDEAARKKNAATIKTFTVGKIIVDLSREIQAIWANAAQYGPFGTAIGAAQTAFAAVRSGLAIRKVTSQKFSMGGILRGAAHAQGGIPFTVDRKPGFEAEGGEIILAKGVYRNPVLRQAASTLNVMGGGRRFATGGPVNPIASSSAATASRNDTLVNMTETNDLLRQNNSLLVQTAQAMNSRIDRIKVVNVATETQAVNDEVTKIKNEADV